MIHRLANILSEAVMAFTALAAHDTNRFMRLVAIMSTPGLIAARKFPWAECLGQFGLFRCVRDLRLRRRADRSDLWRNSL